MIAMDNLQANFNQAFLEYKISYFQMIKTKKILMESAKIIVKTRKNQYPSVKT